MILTMSGMSDRFFPEYTESATRFLHDCEGKKVAVIGHVRPDGDCIGSQVAWTRILNQSGAFAESFNWDAIPKALRGFAHATPFHSGPPPEFPDAQMVVTVDCSAIDRIGEAYRKRFPSPDLCIDHHVSNTGFAKANWINAKAAATAEIIAGVSHDLGLKLDALTAQALYVGMATDTGQFCYEATTERVFEICGWLLKQGANPHQAALELYEKESTARLDLLQRFLETLRWELNGRVGIGFISRDMFAETGTHREDTEGFINYPRSIETVQIALLMEEQPDGSVKGSLRSNDPKFRVDQLAARFSGGGHACAAGFHAAETLESFPAVFLETAIEHLETIS